MNISVLGCGRWGTFIAWYLNKAGHQVLLWGRETSKNYKELAETRKNDYLALPEGIELTNSLEMAIGSLMARGTREISRLVRAMGGNDITIYGLSHLGDYEATLFSPHSHNRKFGQSFVEGERFGKLAEGVATVEALMVLSKQYNVEMPISGALYQILFENAEAKETLEQLFLRPIKFEF